MNREILFRAKRKDNNEWIEGSLLILESGYYIVSRGTYYNEIDITKDCTVNAIWEEQDFFEVIPETISQYIGLDDMNGTKIFENDIVEDIDDEEICTISFDGGSFVLYYDNGNFDYLDGVSTEGFLEVIGNIFDNTELLDKKVNNE